MIGKVLAICKRPVTGFSVETQMIGKVLAICKRPVQF